ncbi:hypothetical protein JMJ77_0011249 [Colletotrichum scovillei]|uniref:Uncharacterized protein n=1 Tax=Colletotrichum scovillei TaxID=1209932 RepID=A0A9P7R4Y6_9PEZI|nr:hypothetical protein JMJ77_0011249 [Colletotrichum scovillei]KAG7060228.1 hypothetical protein JMJ78_0015503 [Colletotrichum scovillei]KAG7067678.1 hypothetical protein JMJ76_0009106 [Colletotrichum scovillei]
MIGLTEEIHPLLSQSVVNEISSGRGYSIGESDTIQKNAWRQQMEYDKCMSGTVKISLTMWLFQRQEDLRHIAQTGKGGWVGIAVI